MTDEFPPEQVNEEASEFNSCLTIGRVMFIPAAALAGIVTLGCVVIAVLGEFRCAEHAVNPLYPTRGFLMFPAFNAFCLAVVRAAGYPSGVALQTMRSSFELYNIPLFEVFSVKITFFMMAYLIGLIGFVAAQCLPMGIAFVELKPLWAACVMTINDQ